jgi:hypothetical protein
MFVATISGTSTEGTGIVMKLPTASNGALLIPEWWSGGYFLELDPGVVAAIFWSWIPEWRRLGGGYRLTKLTVSSRKLTSNARLVS